MNFFDVIKTAHANLFRSKGRTILTIIAIFIGAFTIYLTTGINNGANDYIDKQINGVGGEDQLIIMPASDQGPTDGPQRYQENAENAGNQEYLTQANLDDVAKLKNIKSVKPFTFFSADYIESSNKEKYVFSAASPSDINIDLEAGRDAAASGDAYEINLAPEYVAALGFKNAKEAIGQTVTLAATANGTGEQETLTAKIVGVRNVSVIQNGESIVSQALADKLSAINETGIPDNMKNQYYAAFATMKTGLSEEQITDLKDELADKGYMSQTVEDQIGMIKDVVNAITGVLTIFGAIALLAASFGIINTLYMSVQDRTREIGLMKAMGMSNGKVFLTFSVEALLIGFWGAVLGILGAIGAGTLVNKIAADSFLEGLTGFTLIQFSIPSTLVIILIIMAIAFLAGTLPANRASRLDPINALRYE